MSPLHRTLAALAVVVGCGTRCANAGLVAAAVIPHGDFAALPEIAPSTTGRVAAQRVHAGVHKARELLSETQPDVVVLITPHGQALSDQFAVYLNAEGAGFANLGQDLHNASSPLVRVEESVQINVNLSKSLLRSLACKDELCTGLSSFGGSEAQPLRWGEVIPLSLARLPKNTSFVFISLPSSRYLSSSALVPRLHKFGLELATFLEQQPHRVALLLSSDLAHTHDSSGPYGFSSSAQPFDDAIGRWSRDPLLHREDLLRDANALVDTAMSCGYLTLIALQGALEQTGLEKGCWEWRSLALEAPTYYGMLVADFVRKQCSPIPHQPGPFRQQVNSIK